MENSFKRLLSLVMVVLMVVSMVPTTVFAAETKEAEVNSVQYDTVAEAVRNATAGQTVTLLTDVERLPAIDRVITIDGDGHTVSTAFGEGQFGTVNGTVTIKNVVFANGNESIRTDYLSHDYTNLDLVIEGCTFNNLTSYAIMGGKADPDNHLLKSLTVAGCTFNTNEKNTNYMVYAQCVGTLNISGCTFNGGNVTKGAIHTGDSTAQATVATISGNQINGVGRGVQIGNRVEGSQITLDGNTFTSVTTAADSKSGAIYIHGNADENVAVSVTDNKINSCTSALYNDGNTTEGDSIVEIITTFTGNTVDGKNVVMDAEGDVVEDSTTPAVSEIDLSKGSYTITEPGEYTVIQSDASNYTNNTLTIKADATVTLTELYVWAAAESSAISIEGCDAKLIVSGYNTLYGGDNGAGIYVAEDASVTITSATGDGDDWLEAVGNVWKRDGGNVAAINNDDSGAAGIGGTWTNGNSGAITIDNVCVTAIGTGVHGSGIGSGSGKVVGEIVIKDSYVLAQGGYYVEGGPLQSDYGKSDPEGGAAIGGGGKTASTVAAITITDSAVDAYGGSKAAGIGANFWSSVSDITISGDSEVYAYGGSSSAGIGTSRAGDTGVSANITISGGTVNAIGGAYGAGIGAGYNADSLGNKAEVSALPETSITISGGNVTATGGEGGAGIGGGYKSDNVNIDITGGTVTATAGALVSGKTVEKGGAAAAIGSGANGSGVFENSPAAEISDAATVTVTAYEDGKAAVEGVANTALGTNVTLKEIPNPAAPAISGTITDCQIDMNDPAETFIASEIMNLNATKSVEIKLYSGDTHIATTTLQKSEYFQMNTLGVKIIITGESSTWYTKWEEGKLSPEYVPDKVVLFVDGKEMSSAKVPMIKTNGEQAVDWADVPGVAAVGLKGEGTEKNPYQIGTKEEMFLFAELVNNGTYKDVYVVLTDDIDLEQDDWTSIGTSANPFTGTFDGQGKTISDLWCAEGENGLFGYTSTGNRGDNTGLRATITNFTLNGAVVNDSAQKHNGAAAVVGCANMNTTVSDVTVTGEILITGSRAGVVVGYNYSGLVADNCHVDGVDKTDSSITSVYWAAGGICGFGGGSDSYNEITNCSVKNITINAVNYYGAAAVAGNVNGKIENVSAENVDISAANQPEYNGILSAGDPVTGESSAVNVTLTVGGKQVDGWGDIPVKVTYPVGNPVYPEGRVEYYTDMLKAVPYTTNCPRLEGATVKLLANVAAPGLRLMENDLTLDLNTYTYTITDGTGSQGTNTSGFQIRPEVTTTATIKNGTIEVAEGAPVVWMFNNYATNFVVEDVTVDCANMAYSYGESVYIHVSRAEDNTVLKGNTQFINFDSDKAGHAINVGGDMTVEEAVVPGGSFELDAGATLTAPAGLTVVTADGYKVVYENGVYSTKAVNYVAQIGEKKYESLDEAFKEAKNGDEVKILAAGTYALSTSGNNITITGAVDGVVFDNIGAKNMGSANVTFNNVTFDYYPNVDYTGLQHSGNLVYNNCTFNGQVFLYGASETFKECTFNQNSADAYNVWTYSADEVNFDNCTFNSAGKSVLIYNESQSEYNKVNVTDCDFIASTPVAGKAAIEMDSSLTAGILLTIDADTTVIGFGTGNVSGISLWNNKKGNYTDANNDITVVVNGETVLAPVTFVAQIGEKKYESLDEALDAAKQAGMTEVEVILLADCKFSTKVKNFTKVTFKGTDRAQTLDLNLNAVVDVGNVELVFEDLTVSRLDKEWLYHWFYAGKITYSDCKMIGLFNVSKQDTDFIGCDFYNDDSFGDGSYSLWVYNCHNGVEVNVTGCTFDVYERAIKMYGDGYTGSMVLNISRTEFTSRTADKTVVEIAQDNNCSAGKFTLNVNESTYTGFGNYEHNGSNTESTLFNVEVTNVGGEVKVFKDTVQLWPVNNYVAEVGGVKYKSLDEALNAAQDGDTVTLLTDVALTQELRVEADDKITLDLNGYVIDGQGQVRIAVITYGDLTVKDSSNAQTGAIKAGIGTAGNTVNVCGGTFTLESGSIYSLNNALLIDEEAATVNIKGGSITAEPTTRNSAVMYISSTSETVVNIEGGELVGYNGILLWDNTEINMTGGSIEAKGSVGIQGNGSKDNTEINISGDAAISGYYTAIYHPQGGELNISDNAALTGWTGVVVKGGVVNISGGTISGTGEADTYKPVSSGFVDTGDALYIEHYDDSANSENYGTPVVTVTGGTFESVNAKAIASYVNSNNNIEALTGIVSGGTFNTPVPEELCAEGFIPVEFSEGIYGVQVGLPEVAITDIKNSLTGEDPDLTFALNFAIPNVEDLTEEYLEQLFEAYGDYYVDYILTISGLDGDSVTFNANGGADGYLAGQYDAWSESWVTVPFSDVVVNDGESLYIMEYAAKLMGKQGLRFTLAEVAAIVQNFDCGVYFTPEFLAEHPDLEVNLQLKVFTEDAEGNKIENIDVATNEFENSYAAAVTAEGEQTVYYATFAEAYDAAQAGETVELLQDVKLTTKLTISKGITIDGNGCSIIADETAVWYTVSGKLNIKNYKTHLLGINADGIVLKDIVLDCNDNAAGINVYCAQDVVFDNISVINDSKGFAAVTVNGSTLTLKDKFSIEENGVALDISNGSGVTSTLGVTIEDGTVLDLNSKVVKFASVANNDMTGAVDANGDPYFAAMDNAYYYTQAQIDSRTTGYTNGLTLLTNVILGMDVTISSTLDLNGHNLTVADGKVIQASGNLTLTGEGSVDGTIKLTTADATLTAPAGMKNVLSGVEGYKVIYSGGVYMLVNETTVAWNVQTGEEYESVQVALLAAKNGETVQLLADADESAAVLTVLNGITLDLNGHTLSAYYVMTATSGSYVIDSTDGKGLLKVAKDNLVMAVNSQIMVWKEDESGYRFATVTYGTQVKATGEGSARFNFYLKELDGIVLAELADGDTDNDGLSIQVKMTYTNSMGKPTEMYFNFPMDEVQNYAANLPGYLFMGISGLDTVTDVTFAAVVKSGNVRIESAPVPYEG